MNISTCSVIIVVNRLFLESSGYSKKDKNIILHHDGRQNLGCGQSTFVIYFYELVLI